MPEKKSGAPDPEELNRINDEMVATWEQLPAEHQASMALVLLQTIMDGEWGEWMKEAIALKWP